MQWKKIISPLENNILLKENNIFILLMFISAFQSIKHHVEQKYWFNLQSLQGTSSIFIISRIICKKIINYQFNYPSYSYWIFLLFTN